MKQKGKISADSLQTTSRNKKVSNAQSANQQTVPGKIYSVRETSRYKRSSKQYKRRGSCERQLTIVIDILASGGMLPSKYLKHHLGGPYKGCLECHIFNDLLLIWKRDKEKRVIILIALGTHSELFDKDRR